jgi:ferrous iron transport protein B
MVARRNEGVKELLQMVHDVATGEIKPRPHRIRTTRHETLDRAIDQLVAQIETEFPGLPNARWVALRLLDGDEQIEHAIRDGGLGDLSRDGHEPVTIPEGLMIAEVPA